MRVMVQIDGAYLERMLSEEHNSPAVDYSKLVNKLVNTVITTSESDLYLLRTYYYHALPWIGKNPTEAEEEMYRKKQGFFTRLEHLPRFDVYLGAPSGSSTMTVPLRFSRKGSTFCCPRT